MAEFATGSSPCAEGPDRCMDDLCRGNDVGLCGAWSDRLHRAEGWDDDEDWTDDDDYPDRMLDASGLPEEGEEPMRLEPLSDDELRVFGDDMGFEHSCGEWCTTCLTARLIDEVKRLRAENERLRGLLVALTEQTGDYCVCGAYETTEHGWIHADDCPWPALLAEAGRAAEGETP